MSSHTGPENQLAECEDQLLRFIFEHREQGSERSHGTNQSIDIVEGIL